MTIAPDTLPGRNQPGPSGSAMHRRRAHYKACHEFMACMPKPVCAWAQGTGLVLGELGSRRGTRACRGRSLGGAVGCAGRCAATHLGLTCTPWACSSPPPATCMPSLRLPWCVLTLGGVLWDAHPWMPKQTDPTLDLHLRELTYTVVHFSNRNEILSWYCDFAVTWKLSWAWNRERRNQSAVLLDGFAQQVQQLLDSHRWSITPTTGHAWWAQSDAPCRTSLAGQTGPVCAGPFHVHCKAEWQVVYSHSSNVWQAWQTPWTISKALWSMYSGLLGLKSKISQVSSWVLQLLARIPLTANLDVWKSPRSDFVCNLVVSLPWPPKVCPEKNLPYKIPLKPIQKDECPFGCHYNYHNQKRKQQDQWKGRSTGQTLCPWVKMNTLGQEVTVCLQRAPKSFIIYG